MIRSMTGFGRCRATVDGLDITVEIKSVNSRFFDCNTKISRAYSYLEERVKPYLQSRGVSRGKVDVWIGVETLDSGCVDVALDEGYLRGYLEALYRMRDEFGLRDDISVMSVSRRPELFLVKKPEEDVERDWARVLQVLEQATEAFLSVRAREGEALAADMRAKILELSHPRGLGRQSDHARRDASAHRMRHSRRQGCRGRGAGATAHTLRCL